MKHPGGILLGVWLILCKNLVVQDTGSIFLKYDISGLLAFYVGFIEETLYIFAAAQFYNCTVIDGFDFL